MNALPCISDLIQHDIDRDVKRQDAITELSAKLFERYWTDDEKMSEALCDALHYSSHQRDIDAKRLITMLRDGSDDLQLACMIRKACDTYLADEALDQARHKIDKRGDES